MEKTTNQLDLKWTFSPSPPSCVWLLHQRTHKLRPPPGPGLWACGDWRWSWKSKEANVLVKPNTHAVPDKTFFFFFYFRSKLLDLVWGRTQRRRWTAHPPESTGEEAALGGAVSDQLQRKLGVLNVTVRQQQQVPDATRRRQQAERSQRTPQLSAAPYQRAALPGGREADMIMMTDR